MSGILWRIKLIKGGYNYINYYYLLLLFLLLYGSWKTSRFTPMNQNSRRTTPNSMVCPGQRHPSGPHRIPGVSKNQGHECERRCCPTSPGLPLQQPRWLSKTSRPASTSLPAADLSSQGAATTAKLHVSSWSTMKSLQMPNGATMLT